MRIRFVMRFSSEEGALAFPRCEEARRQVGRRYPDDGRRTAPPCAVAPFVAPAPGLRAAVVQPQRFIVSSQLVIAKRFAGQDGGEAVQRLRIFGAVVEELRAVIEELKAAMFLVGASNLRQLRGVRCIVNRPTSDWIDLGKE